MKTYPWITGDFERTDIVNYRKYRIYHSCRTKEKNPSETVLLTNFVIDASEEILNKHGRNYTVARGKTKIRRNPIHYCYANAAEMMELGGYGYVEGYVRTKDEFRDIHCHAWNVDKNGNHLDFTFKDPENFEYFGIIIPKEIVEKVGFEIQKNTWYAVLPFLDDLLVNTSNDLKLFNSHWKPVEQKSDINLEFLPIR